MGVEMELEFDKYCKVGRSPRTVLPAPRSSTKGETRSKQPKPKPCPRNKDYDLLRLEDESFKQVKFRNYRSVSCKNLPSGDVLERNEVLRRGSLYQSSTDRTFRSEAGSGRKKIEFSLRDETSFSFSLLDSICGSDEEPEAGTSEHDGLSDTSLKPETVSSSKEPNKPYVFSLKDRHSSVEKSAQRDLMGNHKFSCDQVRGPSNYANLLKERDTLAFNKSLSAKLALPQSPTHSEGDSSKGSPKSRFTPIKKMFDPLTKSKSHKSPLDASKLSVSDAAVKNKVPKKSLMHDFSSAVPSARNVVPSVKKDDRTVVPPNSPAHLSGSIKMEYKHGVPYFEFSMDQSDDVLVAKTWKAENALNWVYTFHSVQGRKRSSASGWGMKYSNKDSPMVGQMQVSCYLCSELKGAGAFSNSMVTEFVLYDIAHARKSVASEEEGFSSTDISKISSDSGGRTNEGNVELDELFSVNKPGMPATGVKDHSSVDFSSPYPLTPADLHSSLEIAAVVVRVPFEKRESLKYNRGDTLSHQVNALDLSSVGHAEKSMRDENNLVKVNVVTPLGNHGLPNSPESRGPSPLLDKWRLGGGCDCGGWDMSCPLVVFGNPSTECVEETSLLKKDQPLKLYVQGGKENGPAVTITVTEKRRYAIDFHAQLSTLQAFAVSVAFLHTTEAFSSDEREKNKQLLQCSSLKVFVEDEVKTLIESVTAEEKRKVMKTIEENPPSFVLNPPFSPIARV